MTDRKKLKVEINSSLTSSMLLKMLLMKTFYMSITNATFATLSQFGVYVSSAQLAKTVIYVALVSTHDCKSLTCWKTNKRTTQVKTLYK